MILRPHASLLFSVHNLSLTRRQAFMEGVRMLLPMLLGVFPFGVIYGVIALQNGIEPLPAMLMSSILFAGASQFLLAQIVGLGAPALITFAAVGMLNARHALYSASVAPYLSHLPRRWKVVLAYLLTDEAYAAAISRLMQRPTDANVHWVLFGSGLTLWTGWQFATLGGIVLGSELPSGLDLDFALPLTFIAIVVPMIKTRSLFGAALVAGTSAVIFADLPYRLSLLLAAVAGLIAYGLINHQGFGAAHGR